MFDRKNWEIENIIRMIARVPGYQAHFMVVFAMLGAMLTLVGIMNGAPQNLNAVPAPLLFLGLGVTCFALFFPLPYIIYLAKDLQRTKERLEKIERDSTHD